MKSNLRALFLLLIIVLGWLGMEVGTGVGAQGLSTRQTVIGVGGVALVAFATYFFDRSSRLEGKFWQSPAEAIHVSSAMLQLVVIALTDRSSSASELAQTNSLLLGLLLALSMPVFSVLASRGRLKTLIEDTKAAVALNLLLIVAQLWLLKA